METIEFWSDGLKLVADVRRPEGSGPHPAMVVCPGMGLTRRVWVPTYAEQLTRRGFVTLTPDWRGFGDSEGARLRLLPSLQVRDAVAGLDWLAGDPQVDPDRLGLLGVSLGCSVAVSAAAADSRVRGCVGVAGPADLGRVWGAFEGFEAFRAKVQRARAHYVRTGETRTVAVARLLSGDPDTAAKLEKDVASYEGWTGEITFESLLDLFDFAPEADAGRLRGRPVMLVTPEDDPVIAGDELRSLSAAIGPTAELVVLEGARHVDVYGPLAEEVVERAVAWWRSVVV